MPGRIMRASWRRSPLSLAGIIRTPALDDRGAEDNRTPPSEAEQLYYGAQLRGVPRLDQGFRGGPAQSVGRAVAESAG
jgi:hypothetical protein